MGHIPSLRDTKVGLLRLLSSDMRGEEEEEEEDGD